MIELIVGVIALVVVLGVLYAAPRAIGSSASGESQWPDLLGGLEGVAQNWVERPRYFDLLLGIVTIILLAAAIMIFQNPEVLGLDDLVRFVAFTLAVLGLVGLFSTTYLSVRRSGLHGAEATLLGATVVGIVLILLVSAELLT